MDTKEIKKPGAEKEPLTKETITEAEKKENLKELLVEQAEEVGSSIENLKVSGKKDIEAVEKVGDREDVGEMKEGVEKIGKEARGVKKDYLSEIESLGMDLDGIKKQAELIEKSDDDKDTKIKNLEDLFDNFAKLANKIDDTETKEYLKLFNETRRRIENSAPLKESEHRFTDAYKELVAFNPTVPNYFKRRFEGMNKILEKLQKENIIDKESIDFMQKAVVRDRKNISEAMTKKLNIDIYVSNPGKDESKHEEINIEKYIEHIKKGSIQLSETEDRLDKVDKELTKSSTEFEIGPFADEWENAKGFFEISRSSKNIKEQQANLAVAMHILESIEKGMQDVTIKKALKKIF